MTTTTRNQEIWPNFFIVGAVKAATTSLYYYLKDIPGVYMSPVKETRYFSTRNVLREITDKNEYLDLFRKAADHDAIGEATPSYLWDPDTPGLIHQVVPAARIIMILRDPIERAYSHYLMDLRYTGRTKSFYDELIEGYNSQEKVKIVGESNLYVDLGMYYEQVKRYFDVFGRERVKVVIFEEFVKDPVGTVNEILAFLEVNHRVSQIDSNQYNPYSLSRSRISVWFNAFIHWLHNKNLKPYKTLHLFPDYMKVTLADRILFKNAPKPQMPAEARDFLQKVYHEDVIKLQELLGRTLPWSLLVPKNSNKS